MLSMLLSIQLVESKVCLEAWLVLEVKVIQLHKHKAKGNKKWRREADKRSVTDSISGRSSVTCTYPLCAVHIGLGLRPARVFQLRSFLALRKSKIISAAQAPIFKR